MSNAYFSLYKTHPAGKETIFKNLSKKIELKFISTTWPQQLILTNKVTHQQISALFLITLKTLNFSAPFIMKPYVWSYCLMSTCTWIAFISHVFCLGKTLDSQYQCPGPFLMPEFCQNSQYIQNTVFHNRKHFPQFFDKFLHLSYWNISFNEQPYFMLIICLFFQQWNLN